MARYEKAIYIGNINGQRKYKHIYAHSKKELKEKELQVRMQLKKGIDVQKINNTFEQCAEHWLKSKKNKISSGRWESYKYNIRHLEPLRHIPIAKIRPYDLQEIIDALTAKNPNTRKPMAKKSLRAVKSVAKQIFDFAIENRLIDYNPAVNIYIPTDAPEATGRALDEQEQQWIIDTPHRCQTSALIMMYAGLRRGELIPLMWSDIDFENKTIDINKTVSTVNGHFVLRPYKGKSANAIRTVSIPAQLANHLKNTKKEGLYLSCNAKGGMHTPMSWRRMWESYLIDLNLKYGTNPQKSKFAPQKNQLTIPKIKPHWLRHTYATNLYFAGVDVMTAKELLGHADITTTLNIYTHLDKKHKNKSVHKLETFLANAH